MGLSLRDNSLYSYKTMRQPPGAIRSNAELRLTPAHHIRPGRRAQPRGAGGAGSSGGVCTHVPCGGRPAGAPGRADEAWGGLPKSSAMLISAGIHVLAQGGCWEPESCFALEGLGGRWGETRARKMLPNCYRFGKGSGAGPRSA